MTNLSAFLRLQSSREDYLNLALVEGHPADLQRVGGSMQTYIWGLASLKLLSITVMIIISSCNVLKKQKKHKKHCIKGEYGVTNKTN